MPDPTSRAFLLREAIALDLHAQGIALYNPAPGTVIPPTARAIRLNGVLPTTHDNCLLLTSLTSLSDGRADVIERVQFFGRVKGDLVAAENFEQAIYDRYDQRERRPNVLGISWTWRFSSGFFDADSNGRTEFAATYYFRARRGL